MKKTFKIKRREENLKTNVCKKQKYSLSNYYKYFDKN